MSALILLADLSAENILRGVEELRAQHPTEITQTILLKLRTTRFKEQVLKVTRQRVTNMKSEVLEALRHDLEQITSGATGKRLVDATVALCSAVSSLSVEDTERLRGDLSVLVCHPDPLSLPVALIKAVSVADTSTPNGVGRVRAYLDRWHEANPDGHLSTTLNKVAEAKKPLTQAQKRKGETEAEPRFSPEQVQAIKYAILWRKALQQEHAAQLQTRRITALAEFAELSASEAELVQRLDVAIARRSAGKATESLIAVLCTAVEQAVRADERGSTQVQVLRGALAMLAADLMKRHRRARSEKAGVSSANSPMPFIRELISVLAADAATGVAEDGIGWFRQHLEQWYAGLKERKHLQEKWNADHEPDTVRRIRYASLLHAYVEAACTLSTDALVLSELAEATTRQLGDGVELLYGLLSRCYGETCSNFKYPLTAVLRQATFSKCAEAIISWCQLVVDYKAEQDKRLPGNQPPSGTKRTYSRVDLFKYKRVIYLPLIYSIWCAQEAAYREAAVTKVPIGPDVGKTLGNPERAPQNRRRTSKGWRRSATIGSRFVGKRGARRIKRWLLKKSVVTETLEHLEVIEYPQLFSKERLAEAKVAPHPYWTVKRKQMRTVKAVRPAQFQTQASRKPVRLGQLLPRQRYMLRVQLRELKAYAPQFAEINQAIEVFTEAAPPTYPVVNPVVFTAREAQRLPFEARVNPLHLREALLAVYEQDLDVLRDFRPTQGDPFDTYTPEKLYDVETLRAQTLEQSAAALLPHPGQPIFFHRAMSANLEPKSFTLLVFKRERQERTTERYIFACDLVGEEAPERSEVIHRTRSDMTEPREFVNYPGRHLEGQKGSTLMFFAVEIGDDHQGHLLRDLHERQQQAPVVCRRGCTHKDTGTHLPECAPKAALGTALITSKVNSHGHDEWFAHLAIPRPTPPCQVQPDAVIGFHEHKGQFFFAVVSLQGQLLDIGEVEVPKHVSAGTLKGATSDNFTYEMVWRLLRLSRMEHYTACVAIEHTGWKREVDTSADLNRQRFAFPRERIMTVAAFKAAQEGLLPPVKVRGVAPSRDCGRCGHRLDHSGVSLRRIHQCPHCAALGLPATTERIETHDGVTYQCVSCHRVWEERIPHFKCQQCGTQMYAPYNAAIAVARHVLTELNEGETLERVAATSEV
jgi:hypothetical protein